MFWITLISKPIFNATQDLGSNIYLNVPVIEHKMLQYKITVITLNSDVVQILISHGKLHNKCWMIIALVWNLMLPIALFLRIRIY